ncbi:hypothetical protein N0V83_004319 [Neocucurbitaria cava]|uniref:Uncharacterized protein n=1 Tax=Neocucurbitaria cava TaxID=798079 RepID=A0A9W8Y8B2_9PLEO|nr:hypothetical protein N0V83_004319 [Neocucurbitaria cava]
MDSTMDPNSIDECPKVPTTLSTLMRSHLDEDLIEDTPIVSTTSSRVGLRLVDSFAHPTSATIARARLSLKHAPGSVATAAHRRKQHTSALQYIRAIQVANPPLTFYTGLLRKLRWLGPVKAVPGRGPLDTALLDINLDKEKTTELDNDLAATLDLRSAPLATLLLSYIATTDKRIYEKVVQQLLYSSPKFAPTVASAVYEELQATVQEAPTALHYPSKPSLHRFKTSPTLASRRGLTNLVLKDLTQLNGSAEEYDYSLLAYKILENPDFPVAPFWHAEYASQRSWLDIALELPEDSASGFFAHEIFLQKVLNELNSFGVLPHAGKLRVLRASAVAQAKKMMKAEAEVAFAEESKRLLRCKIEHLIPEVGHSAKELKAIRMIALEGLDDANVLELSDSAIVTLLTAEMEKVMKDEDQMTDLEAQRVCDVISEYSDDIDEDYWNEQSVLDVVCNERKRGQINDWIVSIEHSNIVHFELYSDDRNYCGPLEPYDEDEMRILLEIKLKTEAENNYEGPKIMFHHDDDGNILLPLDDGYELERSEGHYTNMSGFSGILLSTDEDDEDDQKEAEDSASSADVSSSSSKQKKCDEPTSKPDNLDPITPPDFYDEVLEFDDGRARALINPAPPRSRPYIPPAGYNPEYTHHLTRLAHAAGKGRMARRLNSLRSTWDIPHHAHGPEQPGMRLQWSGWTTRPTPDWDATKAVKPKFLQTHLPRAVIGKEAGLLDHFNELAEKRQKEMGEIGEILDVMDFLPPRRPIHADRALEYYGTQLVECVPEKYVKPPPKFDVSHLEPKRSSAALRPRRSFCDDGGVINASKQHAYRPDVVAPSVRAAPPPGFTPPGSQFAHLLGPQCLTPPPDLAPSVRVAPPPGLGFTPPKLQSAPLSRPPGLAPPPGFGPATQVAPPPGFTPPEFGCLSGRRCPAPPPGFGPTTQIVPPLGLAPPPGFEPTSRVAPPPGFGPATRVAPPPGFEHLAPPPGLSTSDSMRQYNNARLHAVLARGMC